jgi:hypothetical protein
VWDRSDINDPRGSFARKLDSFVKPRLSNAFPARRSNTCSMNEGWIEEERERERERARIIDREFGIGINFSILFAWQLSDSAIAAKFAKFRPRSRYARSECVFLPRNAINSGEPFLGFFLLIERASLTRKLGESPPPTMACHAVLSGDRLCVWVRSLSDRNRCFTAADPRGCD